jgi:hypothetical protein
VRRRIPSPILALVAALTLFVAGCGDEGDDAADETTTTADAIANDGVVDDGITMADATLRFTTEDGTIDLQFGQVVCTSSDESSFQATGELDGTTITTEAAGQLGNVVLAGSQVFDGTIEEVAVGDTGALTAVGTGSTPDPDAAATGFTIQGQCN